MVKIEWSQLALGVAMLAVPPFCVLVWLANRVDIGKAFAFCPFWNSGRCNPLAYRWSYSCS